MKLKFILLLTIAVCIFACTGNRDSKNIIAYVFTHNETFDTAKNNIRQLTHINYSFADIIDGKMVEGRPTDSVNLVLLKKHISTTNPDCKLIVSVGGGSWSNNFSDMAITPNGRQLFIASAISFIKKYQLDGLDVDWEYPCLKGNNNLLRKEDKQTYTLLLKELRNAMDSMGQALNKHYILSTAIPCFHVFYENVEIEKVHPYLDFINLMCYDFYGEWDSVSGHQSNLYSTLNSRKLSGDSTVRLLLQSGVPSEKIIYGVPFYSYSWQVNETSPKAINMQGKAVNYNGTYEDILEKYIDKNGFISYWDSVSQMPYLWNDSLKVFITYENPQSIAIKCDYILKNNLGGTMFWRYNHRAENILLNTLYQNLGKKQ